MNYAPGYLGDFSMPASVVIFANKVAKNALHVGDYAARGTVDATAGGVDHAVLKIPLDMDNNGIADAGWMAATGVAVPDGTASEDADSNPPGVDGDGLTRIEEYRGFAVNGVHKRLDPTQKDLFILSQLPEQAGDAGALPLEIHLLKTGEIIPQSRVINAYYANSGYNKDPLRPSTSIQRGLIIVNGGYHTYFGTTPVLAPLTEAPPAQVAGNIQVFMDRIRECSPTNHSTAIPEAVDTSKTAQTIAHEVGHGINIPHWTWPAAPRAATVMVASYFPCPPLPLSDPAWSNWSSVPHSYDGVDLGVLRIRPY
jgi:hypothetical protein